MVVNAGSRTWRCRETASRRALTTCRGSRRAVNGDELPTVSARSEATFEPRARYLDVGAGRHRACELVIACVIDSESSAVSRETSPHRGSVEKPVDNTVERVRICPQVGTRPPTVFISPPTPRANHRRDERFPAPPSLVSRETSGCRDGRACRERHRRRTPETPRRATA